MDTWLLLKALPSQTPYDLPLSHNTSVTDGQADERTTTHANNSTFTKVRSAKNVNLLRRRPMMSQFLLTVVSRVLRGCCCRRRPSTGRKLVWSLAARALHRRR